MDAVVSFGKSLNTRHNRMWECSSTQADLLRKYSWNSDIIGCTIPHPSEFLSKPNVSYLPVDSCLGHDPRHIKTLATHGINIDLLLKGPFTPYLGSSTRESNMLIAPWEKETALPFVECWHTRALMVILKVFFLFDSFDSNESLSLSTIKLIVSS